MAAAPPLSPSPPEGRGGASRGAPVPSARGAGGASSHRRPRGTVPSAPPGVRPLSPGAGGAPCPRPRSWRGPIPSTPPGDRPLGPGAGAGGALSPGHPRGTVPSVWNLARPHPLSPGTSRLSCPLSTKHGRAAMSPSRPGQCRSPPPQRPPAPRGCATGPGSWGGGCSLQASGLR